MKPVRIPPDVARYEERVFWNLTFRQAMSIALGFLAGWTLWTRIPLPFSWKQTLTLLLIPSVLALGWVRVQGLSFERWALIIIRFFLTPQARPWIPDKEGDSL